jgi:hypothetical protein
MQIERYALSRSALKTETGFLLGNGEMGGLGRNDGLGVDKMWFADYWSDPATRAPIEGLRLHAPACDPRYQAGAYQQSLSLQDGILETAVRDTAGGGYESRLFFCAKRPHLVVLAVRNTGAMPVEWRLQFPVNACVTEPDRHDPRHIGLACEAKADYMGLPFTRAVWRVRAGLPFEKVEPDAAVFRVPAGAALVLTMAITTSFDGPDYEALAATLATEAPDCDTLVAEQQQAWQANWSRFSVEIPDGPFAATFYRSIYYLFCITGATRFLQGECQFSDPGWGMHPFTCGTPSWAAWALSAINHPERARQILDAFYKPDAMQSNAETYLRLLKGHGFRYQGAAAQVPPLCFAHEIALNGREMVWDFGRQRHLDGFGSAVFYRVAGESGLPVRGDNAEYQVLRGCAAFYLRLADWDEPLKAYTLPPTLGLDEVVVQRSMLCSVAACYWTLDTFARYARQAGQALPMAEECRHVAAHLYWPQNDQRYVEHLGDREARSFDEYNCARTFSLLGYPFCELVDVLDRAKLLRTLDAAHRRNRLGQGAFNTMTANMYALTEAYLGRGDKAYELSGYCLRRLDASGVAMGEAHNDWLLYFGTGYCSFILSVISMLLQWRGDIMLPFAAVPREWQDASFDNLAAAGGIRVSGRMEHGKVLYVRYSRDGKELLRTPDARPVKIVRQAGGLTLNPVTLSS